MKGTYALDKILELKEFRPYIRGLSVWVGYKQSKVYYVREPRSSGKSNFSIFGSGPVNEFLTGITAYSLKPLYLSIILGFFAMFVSLILILHTIYAKLNSLTALGSAGILISISFFSGIILLSQGIMAIYIARIFEQVRGRKRYVIKDIKEHKCNEDDINTAKLLKKDTKYCPKCNFGITKISGCDVMFCTQCNTSFNWKTMEI